ncbi:lysis protein [Serratia fonticola]|uniref:lysis protein n=1 Tax=Serratia fonticola TaxID=47917 RepID=UPI0027F835AB|nr:lysis protein [Serratia fonticola]MDQ7207395.1 lysis protein [Serratia fonticola]HBE9077629.1 lysis protein [Serratia fonticola]HBE9088200.1 lysis protein [Serratia fonticola]HBE9150358.1 lysis protein [Serratia fonticola]
MSARQLLLAALAVVIAQVWYASELKGDLAESQRDNRLLSQSLRVQSDMQIRANAIDTQRYKELKDAKNEIADLQRAVADGTKQLQLSATCGKAKAASSGGVADGGRPRLTDSAERDYFTLRERIETARSQIAGLQDYINDVCLK